MSSEPPEEIFGSARNSGDSAPKEAPKLRKRMTYAEQLKNLLESLILSILTGSILYISDFAQVLLFSQRIHRPILYVSCCFFMVAIGCGAYILGFQRCILDVVPNSAAYESPRDFPTPVLIATATSVTSFFLTTIAIWPVFHLLSLPLMIVLLVFSVNVLGLNPFHLLPPKHESID